MNEFVREVLGFLLVVAVLSAPVWAVLLWVWLANAMYDAEDRAADEAKRRP